MTTSVRLHFPAQRVTTLFVSPSDNDQFALKKIFSSHSNWNLHSVRTSREALALLRLESIPVVICDHDLADPNLPDNDWRFLLEKTDEIAAPPRVIVASRQLNEHLWAEVLQTGGYDLLAMPWDAREVLKVVSLAWRSWEFACRSAQCAPRPVAPAAVLARAVAV